MSKGKLEKEAECVTKRINASTSDKIFLEQKGFDQFHPMYVRERGGRTIRASEEIAGRVVVTDNPNELIVFMGSKPYIVRLDHVVRPMGFQSPEP